MWRTRVHYSHAPSTVASRVDDCPLWHEEAGVENKGEQVSLVVYTMLVAATEINDQSLRTLRHSPGLLDNLAIDREGMRI